MDKMTIDLDVFNPFMEDIIMRNMNDTLVVTIKRSSRGCRHTYILKKPSKPKELKCGISKGTVFCFSTRAGQNGLILASPRNQRCLRPNGIHTCFE